MSGSGFQRTSYLHRIGVSPKVPPVTWRTQPSLRSSSSSRCAGTPLGEDELEESDVILPPPDLSFIEAAAEFSSEGLIPD
jgi:hypothetical protein